MDTEAAQRVLDGLDDRQLQAVCAPQGPVRILAGAGTGKTRSITHRIAYHALTGQAPAQQVLAVTHSRKAASEMRERLARLGVGSAQARTFHAAALRQLSFFWTGTGLPGSGPNITTDRRTLIRYAWARVNRTHPGQVPSEAVLTVDSEITWAHARLVTPAAYPATAAAAHRVTELDPALVGTVYQAYEDEKQSRGVLDFDDILVYTTQLLRRNEQVAARVRATYTSFVVDEYQDTDAAQQALLEAWLGGRDTVAVVGDTAQAIYGFRGADPTLLTGFTDRYPHAVSVSLDRNYRSVPEVVSAANRVSAGIGGAVKLACHGAAGGEVADHSYPDEDAEARGVAALVKAQVAAGTDPANVAVLHRFNAQSPALRAALTAAGIPVTVRSDDEFFTRPEITAAVRRLRDTVAHEPDTGGLTLLAEVLDAGGFVEDEPPPGVGAARLRWENQMALLEQARSLARLGVTTGADLVAELDRRAAAEHVPAGTHGVTVTTIHKAKGLEWDLVVLARATDGSLPSALASTVEEQAEERRLAYVAVTRARSQLHVTWARTWGKHQTSSTPSAFLPLIVPPGHRPPRRRPSGSAGPKPSAGSLAAFPAGTRITHDRHGVGTVQQVSDTCLVVDFGSSGVRQVKLGEPFEQL